MSSKAIKYTLMTGAIFIAIVIGLYINYSTVPIGERPVQPNQIGGNFSLHTALGDINLEDYQGKVVVLYFGYLSCAEVCPASMGVMSAAFRMLPDEVGDNVQGLFISVDPSRDDLTSLHQFAQHFDPRIKGATGSAEDINKITNQYGVYYDMVNMQNSALSYTVDHVSRFFVIAPTGQFVTSMSYSTTPTELAARIERTLQRYQETKQG
ncbi:MULTISPECIES: SCO family protein [Vibrio]|uniref:SCO family protein n=1 Tax=Vibrio TaxID=662 RepID=UPI0009334150|nr:MULTISPECIES: SCO family protein [Vibrio]PXA71036.1 SCO family protein [Vibrio sp. 11986-1-5]